MNLSKVTLKSNADKVSSEFKQACNRALESCGQTGEGYAKGLCPKDTGMLQNSLTHKVVEDEKTCYIGTDTEYAAYVELGTGVYCTMGGGRSGWWVYVPGSDSSHRSGKTYTEAEARRIVAILRSRGLDAHMTQGQKAQPYLKPAVADHQTQYNSIIKKELENG